MSTERNGELRTERRQVTPPQARTWLEERTANRKIDSGTVMAMARDMVAGRWQTIHQGLAFDAKGELLDGQHRLAACIAADAPFETLITWGLPRDSRLVMDDHRKRSGADVLSIQTGRTVETIVVAILQLIGGAASGPARFSKQELADAYKRYGHAAHFAFQEVKQHVRGVTMAPVLAPVAKAYFTENQERLREFVRVLATGIPQHTPDDIAALRLRDWLIQHREARRRPTRMDIYNRAQNALRHFLERTDISVLRPVETDLFPLPEGFELPVRSIAAARKGKESGQ
jgi:hypothetical protein